MKIKKVVFSNRRKMLKIETSKGVYELPYCKLESTPKNIIKAYVDKELANRCVTFITDEEIQDAVHIDAFLDYNKDPDFIKNVLLHKLTVEAKEALKQSNLPKKEVCRKMKTSASQLNRLLDTSNYKKSIDNMIKLLSVLGQRIDFTTKMAA